MRMKALGANWPKRIVRCLFRLVRGAQRQMQCQNQTARKAALDDVAT